MRKVLISIALMTLMTGNLSAQVLLSGDDPRNNRAQQQDSMVLITGDLNTPVVFSGSNPRNNHGQTEKKGLVTPQPEQQDRFAPLGSGILILSILGGAYLCGRKNKK